ncbi:MAG: ATP-dependent zinc metalloprotease FtsH [Patescibacteria group bacterium]|nr:ATP-dependent zinc metalloprotease FtsH [Patescibacteria group bacterium]
MAQKKKKKKNKPPKFGQQLIYALFIFISITLIYSLLSNPDQDIKNITISDVSRGIVNEEIEKIEVAGENITVYFKDETVGKTKKEVESSLSETLTNYGVTSEQISNISIEIKKESGLGFWLMSIIPFALPILLIVFFIYILKKQVKGTGMQAFTFGQSKARIIDPKDKKNKITLKDVAGVKEAKEELKEVIDFLKNPKKFLAIGARIPKGVILTGAPGTGKTLLARAVAGEASVPFFNLSASEFVEMFVGVGASRVRDLFKLAKKAAPSIIFIDEIDAIGRVRGTGAGGGNDEREQTLNQILVEMDGFEPNEKVIVMASTNRPDVLDPALLRPGRFDRRVVLDLPDRADREEILNIHSRKKPFTEDVKLRVIAERTPGFSGADLSSLMNEGAILAAREDRKKISQYDLIRSIEKVMMGPERKSHLLSKMEKKITAYHEAGHALVASVLPYCDPVHKVSIIARGKAGGYTIKLPLEDRKLHSKKEFLDDIKMTLGGYVAEEMIFNDITTGPSNDLQVSTNLARAMVSRWGMSDIIGPIALEDDEIKNPYSNKKDYSEKIGDLIDDEVSRIIDDSLKETRKILKEKRDVLDVIAQKLIEVEALEQDEFNEILMVNGITPKKKE